MIRINKRTPQPLSMQNDIRLGATVYPTDLNPKTSVELRKILLEDQGYICCYCQRRIPHKFIPKKFITKSKIEHFKSQDEFPLLQLKFTNLFIACNGIGNNKEFTCDTKKGNSAITSFNLLTNNFESRIKYTNIGGIMSDDSNINKDIKDILNLNEENLVRARLGVYNAIKNIKRKSQLKGKFDQLIRKEINSWETKNDGKFKEFKGVGLYFLNKALR